MTASPTAVRQNKIKAISVIKTQYRKSSENKDISTEEITISPANNVHTVYFQNPCYGLTAVIDNGTDDGGNPIQALYPYRLQTVAVIMRLYSLAV